MMVLPFWFLCSIVNGKNCLQIYGKVSIKRVVCASCTNSDWFRLNLCKLNDSTGLSDFSTEDPSTPSHLSILYWSELRCGDSWAALTTAPLHLKSNNMSWCWSWLSINWMQVWLLIEWDLNLPAPRIVEKSEFSRIQCSEEFCFDIVYFLPFGPYLPDQDKRILKLKYPRQRFASFKISARWHLGPEWAHNLVRSVARLLGS